MIIAKLETNVNTVQVQTNSLMEKFEEPKTTVKQFSLTEGMYGLLKKCVFSNCLTCRRWDNLKGLS
jgi:hypothetical protein